MKIGQYNLPAWDKFEKMVDGIFDRQYYTNHGPLLTKLENEMEAFFNVKHAICMTNSDIAKMITLKALDITGEVLVPAFSNISNAQSTIWSSLTPRFYDNSDAKSFNGIPNQRNLTKNTSAIIGTANFGDAEHFNELIEFSKENNLKLILDSEDIIGQEYKNIKQGGFGNVQIFSFNEKSSILNGSDGACVATNDDILAARLRNIRSSYGARQKVDIPYTGNGRMSEIQAGLILLSIEEYETNKERNKEHFDEYLSNLQDLSYCKIIEPSLEVNSNLNYQKVILKIIDTNLAKINSLKSKLKELGVDDSFINFCRHPLTFDELHDCNLSIKLKNSLIELPNNANVSKKSIKQLCEAIKEFLSNEV